MGEVTASADMKHTTLPKSAIMERIERSGMKPNENLGQHFLIDQGAIDLLADSVTPGNKVIEIGAGIGQLTEALAQRASSVVSIEIDRRYEDVLDKVVAENPNVTVIFGDALATKFEDFFPKRKRDGHGQTGVQIVASLPYHITEPFLHKLIGLPVESITLVVGQRLATAIQAQSESSPEFGQLTLLSQTFFDTEVLATLGRDQFYPTPRTESAIVRFIPKEEVEFRANKRVYLLRRLFLTAKRSPLIKNALKEGLVDFSQVSQIGTSSKQEHHHRMRVLAKQDLRQAALEYNSGSLDPERPIKPRERGILTQNQAREIIAEMRIPEEILDKPFEQLDNKDLGILSKALRVV
jgi:16S rRNA (adenine1518-N6/adenine1519-N6)-dimethyltransferase